MLLPPSGSCRCLLGQRDSKKLATPFTYEMDYRAPAADGLLRGMHLRAARATVAVHLEAPASGKSRHGLAEWAGINRVRVHRIPPRQIVRQQTGAALAAESAGAGAKVRQSTPHAYQDFTERFCGLCEQRRRVIAIDNSLSRSASSQLISAKVLPTGECRIFTT